MHWTQNSIFSWMCDVYILFNYSSHSTPVSTSSGFNELILLSLLTRTALSAAVHWAFSFEHSVHAKGFTRAVLFHCHDDALNLMQFTNQEKRFSEVERSHSWADPIPGLSSPKALLLIIRFHFQWQRVFLFSIMKRVE